MTLFPQRKIIDRKQVEALIEEIKNSQEEDQRISQSLGFLDKCLNRYDNEISAIRSRYSGGKILEIGAYPFHLTYFLKRNGYDVVGVDLDPSRFARFLSKNNLDVREIDIERDRFCFEDEAFDAILFNEVFEHLKEPIHALTEIHRILKKDGLLFFSTPNLYFLPHAVYFLSGKGMISDPFTAFSKPYWLGHMGHVREYSFKEVKRFLENLGFKIIEKHYQQNRFFLTPKKNRFLNNKEELAIPGFILFPFNLIYLFLVFTFPFLRENIVLIAKKDKEIHEIFKPKLPKT